MKSKVGWAAALAFLGMILAANYVTTRYGLVPVGFGLMATAGTYLVGLSFILRDLIQDTLGKLAVLALITVGAGLSFLVGDPTIALASAAAFCLSELADFLIYTPLRSRSPLAAMTLSNTAGAVVDTFVFLTLAAPFLTTVIPGFSVGQAAPGQVVGKMLFTVPLVLVWLVHRSRRRLTVPA